MSNESNAPSATENTGRFVVTFREGAQTEALSQLKKSTGVTKSKLMSSADFGQGGFVIDEVPVALLHKF